MSVSILIPTYNRGNFSKLVEYNIKIQNYEQISEVIIADDGIEPLELEIPYKITYLKLKQKVSIGEKRQLLAKAAKTKYVAYMDDDDFYYATYISSSIELLQLTKKKVSGSADMLFWFMKREATGKMCCSKLHLIHEATIVAETKYLKKQNWGRSSAGEGANLLKGQQSFIVENDISKCMVCVVHSNNTISKERWYLEQFSKLELNISTHLAILSSIIS
jgi:glycosyltransferase involved in cell wall biosynthesis